MFYTVKIPWLLKKIATSLVYKIPNEKSTVYITFDDGPKPETTPYILEILEKFNAKATFFCLGKNVESYKSIFNNILNGGHSVGNHSFNHKNGWKTNNYDYFDNIEKADILIKSNLFRPPYGRIKPSQIKSLKAKNYKIIMWDVLSGDFDPNTSKEKCVSNVLGNVTSGSIIVFHDSIKTKDKVIYALPKVLEKLRERGYSFSVI
jgi:peptidoglycan/xylan/chitin deacetylase (PgdA/CDA1 family)